MTSPGARPRLRPGGGRAGFVMLHCELLIPYLKEFVDYGLRLGYMVSFYCLDGYIASENQGWDKDYNFSSLDAARVRWNAVIQAHSDFISTDQYGTVADLIRAEH